MYCPATAPRPGFHSGCRSSWLISCLALFLTSPLPLAAQQAPVATTRADVADIPRRVQLSATVVSPRAARISTDLGGLVETMRVDIGDHVAPGDPLVVLDAALAQLDLQRAEAASREGREQLADAERELRVGRELVAENNLPQNEVDARAARVRITRAALDRLLAEEARQQERLRRHVIRAPFAGVVAERVAEEGEWVSPGTALLELVEMDRLFIDAPTPQRHFSELGLDANVTVELDAYPGQRFPAAVAARVPVSDPTARTFLLRLVLAPSVALELTPGMSARVVLDLATGERGVVLPRDALIRYPDGRITVWEVLRGDGSATVTERQVTLGRAFGGRVHIVSGVKAEAEIVTQGNEALREGQQVEIVSNQGE